METYPLTIHVLLPDGKWKIHRGQWPNSRPVPQTGAMISVLMDGEIQFLEVIAVRPTFLLTEKSDHSQPWKYLLSLVTKPIPLPGTQVRIPPSDLVH